MMTSRPFDPAMEASGTQKPKPRSAPYSGGGKPGQVSFDPATGEKILTEGTSASASERAGAKTALSWADYLIDRLGSEFKGIAGTFGFNEDLMIGWFERHQPDLFRYMEEEVLPGFQTHVSGQWPVSTQDFDTLYRFAKSWLGAKDDGLRKAWNTMLGGGGASRSTARSSGGGRRGPTAQEIRAQFDVDQLTETVSNMYRAYLLTDSPQARSVASAYVEAVVKNPDQKLDFETFVLKRIRGEARHKQLYKNKPDNVDELNYMQPYVQSASRWLRPKNVADVAAGGAQFGADQGAFEGRIGRSAEVTSSSPFINAMEQRVSSLGKVLRG
jgi:hypothetical protein